jgi:tetratricopeptide (TPR) repeat protein
MRFATSSTSVDAAVGSSRSRRNRRVAVTALAALFLATALAHHASAAPQPTRLVGAEPANFKDVQQPSALLVGFKVAVDTHGPTGIIVRSIQPMYLAEGRKIVGGGTYGTGCDNVVEVVAREGYAVGAVVVKAGEQLDGLRVIFMRRNGDRLDIKDSYESRWVGSRGGADEVLLGGDGTPVVGIHGRSGRDVDSLGLVLDDETKPGMWEAKPAEAPPAQDTLYLESPHNFYIRSMQNASADALAQELARQALLLSGREELGLTVRDMRLGDALPAKGGVKPLEISAPCNNGPLLEVLYGNYPQQKVVSRKQLSAFTGQIDYALMMKELEECSRGYFVEVLRENGFAGKQPAARGQTDLPDDAAKLLDDLTYMSQFQAVRAIHELSRREGESPQLTAALVRGYANLGLLTEFHAHPAHAAFKARAMLYAQRAVARGDDRPNALRHRAYALAAAGLNAAALADLAEADKAAPQDQTPPSWAKIIDAYCRYDIKALEAMKDQPDAPLAGLWRFRALEQSAREEMAIEQGEELLKQMPYCCRINDGLSRLGGVGLAHTTTLRGFMLVRGSLYDRLAKMPGLPEAAAEIAREQARLAAAETEDRMDLAEEFRVRAKLIAALRQPASTSEEKSPPTDAGEPTWATLGCIVRDQAFEQILRRGNFECTWLGVAPDEFLALAAPLVADHPFRDLAEVMNWDQAKRAEALARLRANPLDYIEIHTDKHCYLLRSIAPDIHRRKVDAACLHTIFTDHELSVALTDMMFGAEGNAHRARLLLEVSPYSPLARAQLIKYDWNGVKDRAEEWEKQAASTPEVLQALGERYAALKRYEDAERCLKSAIALSPGYKGYLALAEVYKQQDKIDKWQETLEAYLDQPDYGLSHSEACKELAKHFMQRREFEKALPYAEGAARSGSGWGLQTAAECHECLRNLKEAESLYRAIVERYGKGAHFHWYFFCKRRGCGDLDAARKAMLAMEEDNSQPAANPNIVYKLFFHILEKKPEKIMSSLEDSYQQSGNPYTAILAALLHDEMKNPEKQTRVLQQILAGGPENGKNRLKTPPPEAMALAGLMAKDLEGGGRGEIDLDAADKLVADVENGRKGCFYYMLGKYLSLHGKKDQAVACWKKSMECLDRPLIDIFIDTLAAVALREQGIDPDKEAPPAKPDEKKN